MDDTHFVLIIFKEEEAIISACSEDIQELMVARQASAMAALVVRACNTRNAKQHTTRKLVLNVMRS